METFSMVSCFIIIFCTQSIYGLKYLPYLIFLVLFTSTFLFPISLILETFLETKVLPLIRHFLCFHLETLMETHFLEKIFFYYYHICFHIILLCFNSALFLALFRHFWKHIWKHQKVPFLKKKIK